MQKEPIIEWIPGRYQSSGVETTENPDILATGSQNILITGAGKPNAFKGMALQAGKVGGRFMCNAGESYASLGAYGDTLGKGSVVRILAGLFFIGSGSLYYDGTDQSVNASTTLQLRLLTSGVFTGTTYQAGLSQPVAPTIATRTSLGVGMSGKLKAGTYTVKVYKIRTATGARSNASLASNIAISTESNSIGQSLRVTFPAADTNGGDRWGICVTPRNFGTTGPYFLLKEVAETDLTTIDSVPRSYEIEWVDGDLVDRPLAPVDSGVPPIGVFAGALGNSIFIDGCYGDTVTGATAVSPGTVIASSLPLRPEEFPADWLAFPPDAPTALLRGGDGFYYRFGLNSMGVISYTGGEPPISYQLYWGTTGISYPHNAVVAGGSQLYAKTGSKGLVRIGADGQPESLWASPFIDDIEDWTDEETVLGWDENNQQLCIMNNLTIIPFNTTLDTPGAPLDLTGLVSGRILSAVTQLGNLFISCLDTVNSTINVYKFNSGTGTVMKVFTDTHFSKAVTDCINQIDIYGRFDSTNPITVKVFKNGNTVTPILTTTVIPSIGKPIHPDPIRRTVVDMKSFCISLEQQTAGGDCGFEKIVCQGYSKYIVK